MLVGLHAVIQTKVPLISLLFVGHYLVVEYSIAGGLCLVPNLVLDGVA